MAGQRTRQDDHEQAMPSPPPPLLVVQVPPLLASLDAFVSDLDARLSEDREHLADASWPPNVGFSVKAERRSMAFKRVPVLENALNLLKGVRQSVEACATTRAVNSRGDTIKRSRPNPRLSFAHFAAPLQAHVCTFLTLEPLGRLLSTCRLLHRSRGELVTVLSGATTEPTRLAAALPLFPRLQRLCISISDEEEGDTIMDEDICRVLTASLSSRLWGGKLQELRVDGADDGPALGQLFALLAAGVVCPSLTSLHIECWGSGLQSSTAARLTAGSSGGEGFSKLTHLHLHGLCIDGHNPNCQVEDCDEPGHGTSPCVQQVGAMLLFCTSLTTLDLDFTYYDDFVPCMEAILPALVYLAPRLERLHLDEALLREEDVESFQSQVVPKFARLTHLKLDSSPGFKQSSRSVGDFMEVLSTCPSAHCLESLTLSYLDEGGASALAALCQVRGSVFPALETLRLSALSYNPAPDATHRLRLCTLEALLTSLATFCPRLREFDLTGLLVFLEDKNGQTPSSKRPQVFKIMNTAMAIITPRLTTLKMSTALGVEWVVRGGGAEVLQQAGASLATLELCDHCTIGQSMTPLAKAVAAMPSLRSLHIDIRAPSERRPTGQKIMSDAGFIELLHALSGCQRLKRLYLRGAWELTTITGEEVGRIMSKGCWPQLEKICIHGDWRTAMSSLQTMAWMTDTSVHSIRRACPRLREWSVSVSNTTPIGQSKNFDVALIRLLQDVLLPPVIDDAGCLGHSYLYTSTPQWSEGVWTNLLQAGKYVKPSWSKASSEEHVNRILKLLRVLRS